ncbi:MAG TPA: SUMF1/EgtB/PvdO family nonheme iron enzyme [Aggregatilineaceae bacterium]|nr:SUMF1/EgtB/PvdO family nonheme iron enzyme [Aggregatilineaceae bacterium]
MNHIFISYSKKDIDFARRLKRLLEAARFDVWMDESDLVPSEQWWPTIENNIYTCAAFIVIMSNNARGSRWVEREILYAEKLNKPIFPVLMQGEQWGRLADIQFEDMRAGVPSRLPDRMHFGLGKVVPGEDPWGAAPLPRKEAARSSRVYAAVVAVVALILIGAGVVILNNWGGDDGKDKTPNATLDRDAIALTQVAVWATQTTVGTPQATQTTLTPTERPSSTPETPTATNAPASEPSNTPTTGATAAPTIMPTATFIPVGAANEDWTPIEQEINGVPMVYVPAGCFEMGSTDEEIETAFQQCEIDLGVGDCDRAWLENERPAHRVCLTDYWIGETEVTNAQYRRCVEAGVCTLPGKTSYYDDLNYAEHPVVYVDWEQAKTYAEWVGGNLPTEAQWEYAARGPEGWTYPWDEDEATCELANVWIGGNWCVKNTSIVGSYPDGVSWAGALDMSGNVGEWVADWYDGAYYATLADGVVDPSGPDSGDMRVVRGGGWNGGVYFARCASRYENFRPGGDGDIGFRLVVAFPR